jgi:hypothetical protein
VTAPGGFYPVEAHEIVPEPGTIRSADGINKGHTAVTANSDHYPVEALCHCGQVIRKDRLLLAGWYHIGEPADVMRGPR